MLFPLIITTKKADVPPDPGRCSHRLPLFACCAFLFLAELAPAQEAVVPPDLQAKFLLKSLTFDRRFTSRSPAGLVVGVLFQSHSRPSLVAAEEFRDALLSLQQETGRAIRVEMLDLESDIDIAETLKRYRPDILYVPPLRALSLESVIAACRAEKIHTFTAVPEYVRSGIALGLDTRGGRPVILINLPASRAEGADFGSQLLRLAQTVE